MTTFSKHQSKPIWRDFTFHSLSQFLKKITRQFKATHGESNQYHWFFLDQLPDSSKAMIKTLDQLLFLSLFSHHDNLEADHAFFTLAFLTQLTNF